jgi:tRNA modification GTPase
VAEARVALDRLSRAARVGLRLARPWRVVLAGSVNAGKSSLVNALAGHARSIVSPEPGTTRDLLETRIVLDGWEIDLVDTAGLREDGGDDEAIGVEQAGIARAIAACEEADLVLRVVDGRQVGMGTPAVTANRELVVASKADLLGGAVHAVEISGVVWTSGTSGAGVAALATEIVRRLVPEEAQEPALLDGGVPFTDRQVALVEGLRGR